MAWANDGSTNGKLVVVGQLLQNNSSNANAAGSDKTLMVNTSNGTGTWTEIAAPVVVPNAYDNPCPNYASPLLPSVDGTQVLELALDYDAGVCRAYYATGSLSTSVPTSSVNDSATGTGDNQFEFSSGWNYGLNCGSFCFNGDDHYSNTTNASVNFCFTGTQVKLYGAKDPGHGIAAISIDGGAETNVDYYASSRQGQQLMYTSSTLSSGSHALKLRVTGSKNASSSNTFITVDRADVWASTTALNDNTTGTGSNQFDYSSGWIYGPRCGGACFNGDDHYTNTTNSNVQVRFTGTQISLYRAKDPGHGIAAMPIDGGAETNVDYYASSRTGQQVMFVSPTLTQECTR